MIPIATLLAEHHVAAVSRALALIGSNWHDSNCTRWVDPARVLAEAWHKGRLADAKERLAAGERAPAIKVVGYRWNSDWTLYEPSDGIHRTVAAREAGQKVKAKISGYYLLKPQQFVVNQEDLWRRTARGELQHVDATSEVERAALAALGVAAQ
jgi:hypothetical protein